MYEKINQTTTYIRTKTDFNPQIGIVLGSGLGNLGNQIEEIASISYSDIPNFPVSTVKGHQGRLVFGKLGGKNVVAMQGRFHFYEGYSMKDISFPIRVMKELGIKLLILSNAAGGMNPDFKVGDIMIINDHINLFPDNPLMGHNDERLGPRFPDMSEIYDRKLIAKSIEIAEKNNLKVHQGVYVGTSGPTFETPAEYKFFRIIGGDTVGMSTVPEAIIARHAGIPVFAASIVTDLGVEGIVENVSHEEVLAAARAAEPKLTLIIKELLEGI
ncbi:MAG: purine-nucleoside phosphorylase [Bacteroidetes bacterium]|nr:MAG: purine-nucleoside phosphorylase [Bacteroidota bacterium]